MHKFEYADQMMEDLKDKLNAMTHDDFPTNEPQPDHHGPGMLGDHGDNSPWKPRKRGAGGL